MKKTVLILALLVLQLVAALGCRPVDSHHTIVMETSKDDDDKDDTSEDSPTPENTETEEGVKTVPEDTEGDRVAEPAAGSEAPFVVNNNVLKVDEEPYLTGENYQLGDNWSRNLTKAFHENHKTVVRGTVATDEGLISSNFTVLDFLSEDEALFLAAVHALPDCSEEAVVVRTKDQVMHGYCTGIYSVVPETDAVIFALKFFDVDLEKTLLPVSFAQSVERGDRLKFYSIGQDRLIPGYFPLYSDSDIDCLLVSGEERKIADPDTVNPIAGSDYWSLAVSCDVIHGDSGGIVVNRANELVGMVWTGAFPKDRRFTTEYLLGLTREKSPETDELIWTGLNYVVPGYRIFQHLQTVLSSISASGGEPQTGDRSD